MRLRNPRGTGKKVTQDQDTEKIQETFLELFGLGAYEINVKLDLRDLCQVCPYISPILTENASLISLSLSIRKILQPLNNLRHPPPMRLLLMSMPCFTHALPWHHLAFSILLASLNFPLPLLTLFHHPFSPSQSHLFSCIFTFPPRLLFPFLTVLSPQPSSPP